jgi:hypothetical protein
MSMYWPARLSEVVTPLKDDLLAMRARNQRFRSYSHAACCIDNLSVKPIRVIRG